MIKLIGVGIAGVVVGLLLSAALPDGSFGGVYSQANKYFREGVKVGTSDQFTVESDGDVLTTGGVRSDKATFCWDFYATSTATRMKMTASSTATIEGVDGVMVASYGSCS